LSDYVETIAAKRYRNYLKEEERRSDWTRHVIAALLWLMKLITNILEQVGIKSKRVMEKATVE